jgi:hypothetical protein
MLAETKRVRSFSRGERSFAGSQRGRGLNTNPRPVALRRSARAAIGIHRRTRTGRPSGCDMPLECLSWRGSLALSARCADRRARAARGLRSRSC